MAGLLHSENWETPLAKHWMMSLPQLFGNPESLLVRKMFFTDGRNYRVGSKCLKY